MKKNIRNSLLVLAVGTLVVSCADYNETDNFTAQPDPTFVEPYKNLDPVKSYIDKDQYPNMSLGATLKLNEFNEQALAHAAAVTNFDDLYFGNSLMSGAIINAKGVMNFIDMKALLDHVEEIGGKVYGSALAANSGQADGWLKLLTSPIEILVEYQDVKTVDYGKETTFDQSKVEKGTGSIIKSTKDNQNVLQIGQSSNVRIIDGFDAEPKAKYTTTFWVRATKASNFNVIFSGTKVEGTGTQGRYFVDVSDEWKKITVEAEPAEGVTDGYLRIETTRGANLLVKKVQVGFVPDNHRDQTPEEISDTIHWAMYAWCDGFMKNNAGRIKSFDLIEEPLSAKTLDDGQTFDLRHSTDKIFWQDIFGSEKYAPVVSDAAITAFKKYGGNADDLTFFICESGLENDQKYESLMYWINLWTKNGAKIDGINAKVNLTYSENAATQANNEASIDKLLSNLAASGKLVRLSNFDIKYQDAEGNNVTAKDITDAQRQKLADYYAKVIKKYLTAIDKDKQAGICKGNISDTTDPVGLWAVVNKDWVRTATYKAFCDAVSGK